MATFASTGMIVAIAYVRFSSDMQREESIAAQKRAIMYFAKENNINIIQFYEDRALSGKTTDRPGYLAMLDHIKQGGIDAVICHKLDRVSRNLADTVNLQQLLSDLGIQLISVMEKLDNTPSGKLMQNIIASINAFYVDNLASEVMKGMTENASQCITTGGTPPLGYDIIDKKYVINEYEAEAVRLIFQMYDEGYGYNRIISKLNSLGYKTKKGNPFGKNSLYELFRNERYKGTYVFNKAQRRKSDGSRSRKTKPDHEIIRIEGGVPTIVDTDLWHRVNDKMDKNKKQSGAFKAKEVYLLTGLIRCGCCGYAMHGNARYPSKTREKFISYRCNRRDNNMACVNREIKRDEVEDFVISQLERYLFNDAVIPTLTKQLNQYLQETTTQADQHRKQYEKHLAELQGQKNNIVNAIAASGFAEVFQDKLRELEQGILEVKGKLRTLEAGLPSVKLTEDKIREYLSHFNHFVRTKNIPQIKKFIDSYVERVEVFPDRVKVIMKVAFAFVGDNRQYSFEVDVDRKTMKTA